MSKKTVAAVAIGAAIVGVALILIKRSKKKEVKAVEEKKVEEAPEGLIHDNVLQMRPIELNDLKKPYHVKSIEEAVELYHPAFIPFYASMTEDQAARFDHSYILVKRTIQGRYSKQEFESLMDGYLGALVYAVEKKFNKDHLDRGILAETARLIRNELFKAVKRPSEEYVCAALEIETALIRGEGADIYQAKFS